MSFESGKILKASDNVIRISHPELPKEPLTYLTASVAAAGTALTVADNGNFAQNDLILLGNYGDETAEQKKVNAAVSAGTAVTSTAVTFAHGVGTPVRKILWDRAELSRADTATGSKTVISAAITLNYSGPYTEYVNTGTTGSFYFIRYYDGTTYSEYSDAVPITGYTAKTAGFIINRAFENLKEVIGGMFTVEWAINQLYLIELDIQQAMKRWSWNRISEYDMGNIATGDNSYALPSDIRDGDSPKSILGLRIGTNENMHYISKSKYEERMRGVARTTLSAAISSISDVTITLTDTRDFADSGSIEIEGDVISYTSKVDSTGVISGVTGITSTHTTTGVDVWQGHSTGLPTEYTVYDSTVYFPTIPTSTEDGMNIWIDYYADITRLDSLNDSITVTDPNLLISGLEVAIKRTKGNGTIPLDDVSLIAYRERKKQLIQQEISGQDVYLVPDMP